MSYTDIVTTNDYKTKRIHRDEARKLVAKLVQEYPDSLFWTQHVLTRMAERGLSTSDIYNVISSPQAKILIEGEVNDKGVYSYRVETNKMLVVVSFSVAGDKMSIVTAARKNIYGG